MISLLEVAERAQKGSKMDEKEWNLGMFQTMTELSETYKLSTTHDMPFYDVDNAFTDQLFSAALDFLSTRGVYCVSTRRMITFTEDEIRQACREAPSNITIGADRDIRTLQQRKIEDTRLTNIVAGGHSAWNEDLIPLEHLVKELVSIPRVDYLETFNYHSILGREVHGTPLIVYAARKAIERARLGVRLAGRSGLALCYYPIHTIAPAFLAAKDEERGLRSSDGLLLSVLPDLKVETSLLAAAKYYQEYGCFGMNGGVGGTVGGFAGGFEGAMIEGVVRNIVAWIVYRDVVQYGSGVSMIRHRPWASATFGEPWRGGRDEQSLAWCSFAVQKALRRHKNTIEMFPGGSGGQVIDQAAPENLLATAITCIKGTVLGGNLYFLWTPPPTTIRWGVEVSDATIKAGVKVSDLEALLGQIQQEKLQGFDSSQDRRMLLYSDPQSFFASHEACYDYVRQTPTLRFQESRKQAVAYLEDLGLQF
jgi:methylamine--corrinoid protein Co-methyltransferase